MIKFRNYFSTSLAAFFLIFFTFACAHPSVSPTSAPQPSQEATTGGQAYFKVGPLVISPDRIHAGEIATISTDIQNTGTQDGIYTAVLLIDGQTKDQKEIEVSANQAATVEFSVMGLTVGEHTINIGQSEASITVNPLDKIAFVDYRTDKYGFDIFTMNADGTNVIDITKNGSRDVWPTWSPDGTKIAFGSTREPHSMRSIYVTDADGQNVKCLTPEITDCEFPAWSPDGQKIAYCSSKLATAGAEFIALDIFIMNIDGSEKIPVTQHGGITTNACPSWFPDSKHIAYVSNREGLWKIYGINIDGSDSGKYEVCIGQCGMKFPSGQFPVISVSPDGTSIAFDYLDQFGRQDIYLLSIANGAIKNLTREMEGSSYNPSWSPDGKSIAFSSDIAHGTGIYIMDIEGNTMPKFTNQYGYLPVWSR